MRLIATTTTLLLILCSNLVSHVRLAGAQDNLSFKTERVVVFKDGYGMFIKRAQGTTDADGRLFSDEVPDEAILGSVWAESENATLTQLRSRFVTRESKGSKVRPCRDIGELLKANLEREVTLTLSNDETIAGTIRSLIGEESQHALPDVSPPLSSFSSSTRTRIEMRRSSTHVILRSESGETLIPISQVKLVQSQQLLSEIEIPVESKEQSKQFVFEFDTPNTEVDVLLVYFRPGIRWIPTYRVTLGDEDESLARVQLQAEFLNEAESLVDVPLDIVVGVPNFRFRQTPSPLTLEATMRNTLQQAAPQLMNQFSNNASNQMFSQRAGEFRGPRGNQAESEINLPSELTAGGTQDLFVYHLDPMTLELKERAAVQLFDAQVPYRHVYTWNAHVKQGSGDAAPTQSLAESPLVLSENEVWHQIELENTTDVPWTTGAAMLLENHQPLSQELLTYTSIGSSVRVPVTVAVDLRGSLTEEETARELNALEWRGYRYAKITKRATLKLTNRKQEAITFEISCMIGGRATEATQEGAIEIQPFQAADWENYRGVPAVNNHSNVRWSKQLKPGETFEATVDYHFFARH